MNDWIPRHSGSRWEPPHAAPGQSAPVRRPGRVAPALAAAALALGVAGGGMALARSLPEPTATGAPDAQPAAGRPAPAARQFGGDRPDRHGWERHHDDDEFDR